VTRSRARDGRRPGSAPRRPGRLWGLARHCARGRLDTLASADAAAKAADLGHFKKLAAAVDGLEHVAGVEKGGTFILVSDGKPAAGTVVADFSLASKLPCCCHADLASLCLPPVARPDHRIVHLREEDREIDVLANDFDPYGGGGDLVLIVEQEKRDREDDDEPPRTELGGTVEVVGGLVHYEHKSPPAGGIDRFTYVIERDDKDCRGRDTGQVLILFLPEVEEEVSNGRIAGTVFDVGHDGPAGGATVVRKPSGEETKSNDNGEFGFENVPPGKYTLVAARRGLVSLPKEIDVAPGGDVKGVELVLQRGVKPGGAKVLVVAAETEKPIANATVVMGTVNVTATTKGDGVARFTEIPPGTYPLSVSATGFLTGKSRVDVKSDATASVTVGLEPAAETPRFLFEIDRPFLEIATRTGAGSEDDVRALFDRRYRKNLKAVAGQPEVVSRVDPSRKNALDFLTKVVAGPAAATIDVIGLYRTLMGSFAGARTSVPLMEAVTRATFDRIAVMRPGGLTGPQTRAIVQARDALVEAGVKLERVRAEWGGLALSESHGAKSFVDLDKILAGG